MCVIVIFVREDQSHISDVANQHLRNRFTFSVALSSHLSHKNKHTPHVRCDNIHTTTPPMTVANTTIFLLFTLLLSVFTLSHKLPLFSVSAQTLNAFSSTDKTKIVERHNLVRFSPSLSPPAANMKSISWDDQLAQIAANYVDNCLFEHNPNLGTIYSGGALGENIYMATGSSVNIGNSSVDSWASEKQYFTYPTTCQTVSDGSFQWIMVIEIVIPCFTRLYIYI